MPFRRLRNLIVVLTLPLVMADAGPRCGGSSPRREPPNEDASERDDAPACVTLAERAA